MTNWSCSARDKSTLALTIAFLLAVCGVSLATEALESLTGDTVSLTVGELDCSIGPGGVTIQPRAQPSSLHGWSWRWQTLSVGRAHSPVRVSIVGPELKGAQISYFHGPMTEWYEVRGNFLEQFFSVETAPDGVGPLLVEAEIVTDLVPCPMADGRGIKYANKYGQVLFSYSDLVVLDAGGRSLPSRIALAPGHITLQVDDSEAQYPLFIDPIISGAPAWTAFGLQDGAEFGAAMAPVGDFNGDGYTDFAVGSPRFDVGTHPEAGMVWLFYGTPSGLQESAIWSFEGSQDYERIGWSVGGVGDLNGDGYADLVVGAPNYDDGPLPDPGRILLFLGSSTGPSASPDDEFVAEYSGSEAGLAIAPAGDANADGLPDFVVLGDHVVWTFYGSYAGQLGTPSTLQVADRYNHVSCGDVNGDAYVDLVATDVLYDSNRGRIRLHYGTANGFQASPEWTLTGAAQHGQFGSGLDAHGDVDGDGYADILVGEPGFDSGGLFDIGQAQLFRGSSGNPAFAWSIEGTADDEHLGSRCTFIGDVNGDGYADAAIRSWSESDRHRVQVFEGSGSENVFVSPPVWTGLGDATNDHYGACITAAGDPNADGFGDVAIAAPGYNNKGRVVLHLGIPGDLQDAKAWSYDGTTLNNLGRSLAGAGDINGDGFADFIVGAEELLGNGRVYLFKGGPDEITSLQTPLVGEELHAKFGYSVAWAGDVNGDGYSDIVVGSHRYGARRGRTYVYAGSPTGVVLHRVFTGDQDDGYFGYSVASAGDVNGDGYGDILVGQQAYDGVYQDEGKVLLYLGSSQGLAATPTWSAVGNQLNARFGHSVACAGDVNGDGYDDVLVGAIFYDNPEVDEGKAFLYYGASSGQMIQAGWSPEGNQENALFGCSVASAGDNDADGYSDIIIGAYGLDSPESNEGKAYWWKGAPSSLTSEPQRTWEGGVVDAYFGYSVASAGDVNSDGFGDIVIGAQAYMAGEVDEGRAFVYLGSPSGPSVTADWTAESGQAGARFGVSVACAGDVNGDGFDDLAVGALLWGGEDEGRAYVYYGGDSDGLDRRPRQATVGGQTIDLLGRTDVTGAFRFLGRARVPFGRGDVRLEWNVGQPGGQFGPLPGDHSSWYTTGAPVPESGSYIDVSQHITGVGAGNWYRWRMRFASLSPYYPHTPWFSPSRAVQTQRHFRTPPAGGGKIPGIGGRRTVAGDVVLFPNPGTEATSISYSLVHESSVSVALLDLSGRRVATLYSGRQAAGDHAVSIDAAIRSRVPSGAYFLQLVVDGEMWNRKVILFH